MDHLSFMFSLLLIVSVTSTTLGSAIKAKNPHGEELEPLLEPSDYSNPRMSSRDQVSEKQKRLDPARIISGDSLDNAELENFLTEIGKKDRKIAIGIDNESGFTWMKSSYYFFSGTSDKRLPRLQDEKAVLYPAFNERSEKEVNGVVAYYIPRMKKTIAFMFHAPRDYDSGQNLWNVKLYKGEKRATSVIFQEMISDKADPKPADDWYRGDLGHSLEFEGAMSDSGRATLEIHVRRKLTSN